MYQNLLTFYKLNTKLFLIYSLLLTTFAHSQKEKIDSLKYRLSSTEKDSSKIDLMLNLAAEYQAFSQDSSALYSRKAMKLSKKTDNYKLTKIYVYVGVSFMHESKMDSARFYYDKTLSLLDKKEDTILRSYVYSNYGSTYTNTFELEKQIEYDLKAINLVEKNDAEVCMLYFNLATTYAYADFWEKSVEYLKKAYNSSKIAKDNRVLGASIQALASQYIEKGKNDIAKSYLEEGQILCAQTKSPELCYGVHHEIGKILSAEKKFQKARKNLEIARDYAEAHGEKYDLMASYTTLGQNEADAKNYRKASEHYEKFDFLYKENPIPVLGVTYRSYAINEAKRKNFKKSYAILDNYLSIKDSIFDKEKRGILADMEEKYESEKKEREIAEQKLQIQDQKLDLTKKQTQITWWTALGSLLLLMLGGSFWYNKERQKRKQQEIDNLEKQQEIIRLEALVDGEEKERVRLAQDLHDGINGDLSVIKFKIDSLTMEKYSKEDKKFHTQAIAMLDNAIDQVRRISHNLAPPSLHNFSLLEALKTYCNKIQSAHSLKIDFQNFGNQISLGTEQETAVYRIVQELLNNIVKHAGAKEVLVQLNNTDESLGITVEDDGRGFDTQNVKNGIGLQNIASRVSFLKGDLHIDSNEKGSSFTVNIPYSKNQSA